jgi:ABC-type transport system involved in multi-copper enzyme maturation permease subunit
MSPIEGAEGRTVKAYALIAETFLRKLSIRIVHVVWLVSYALMFLIPFGPSTWQWGGFLFAWSGCVLPLALSAGIFGDDIASGRIRLIVTEPIRPVELYVYRFLGLSLQAAVHLLAAGALILLLHRLTGRGGVAHFAVWLLASWSVFNTWAALSTSVSVLVNREHNATLLVLATIAAVFPLYVLLLFFEDSTGTKIYHEIVRYAGPPVEILVRMGRGKCSLPGSVASVAHSLLLTVLYGAAGIALLGRREFKYAAD